MSALILRINNWWNARETSTAEAHLQAQLAESREQVASLTEELEHERVQSRIRDTLIEEQNRVIARNLERVSAEIRVLGGDKSKATNGVDFAEP
jgi:pheromone shutdown protein TraB